MKHDEDFLILDQGRFFEAHQRAEAAAAWSNDSKLQVKLGLALSKMGMPERALETVMPAYNLHPDDPEVSGILGSIYKELFKKNQLKSYAIQSRDTYLKNFEISGSYYTGINAASMAVMAGSSSKGKEIASRVIQQVLKQELGFWELATLGEAQLLLKNKPAAVENYVAARKKAGRDWGKITSVHNQLWLLNHYLPVPQEIQKLFAPPNIMAFAGHMIDAPSRQTPRFPPYIEAQVKEAIRNAIRSVNAFIGYSSLACSGDILFAEVILEEGGEINILMPFNTEDFIKTSVAFAGPDWVSRFHAIVKNHAVRFVTEGQYNANDDLFTLLGKVVLGSAIQKARTQQVQPYFLTVQSEIDLKQNQGGTRDVVDFWPRQLGRININPDIYLSISPQTASPVVTTMHTETQTTEPTQLVHIAALKGDDSVRSEALKMADLLLQANPLLRTQLVPVTNQDTLIVAFASDQGAIELISATQKHNSVVNRNKPVHGALHLGVVPATQKGFEASVVFDEANQLVAKTSEATILASHAFAALLSLAPLPYKIDQAGIIQTDRQSLSVYTIQRTG